MDFLFGGSSLNPTENSVEIFLSSRYGAVLITAVASSFLLMWQGFQVGKARKQFNIQYPTMYATNNDKFNCYQRAHQNTLEGYTTFLLLLLVGGLEMPVAASIAGVIWIAGKVSYSKGYYTGDPKNRMRGAYAYIGLLTLLFATLKFSVRLLMR